MKKDLVLDAHRKISLANKEIELLESCPYDIGDSVWHNGKIQVVYEIVPYPVASFVMLCLTDLRKDGKIPSRAINGSKALAREVYPLDNVIQTRQLVVGNYIIVQKEIVEVKEILSDKVMCTKLTAPLQDIAPIGISFFSADFTDGYSRSLLATEYDVEVYLKLRNPS